MVPMSSYLHGVDLFGLMERQTHKRRLTFGAGFLGMHVNHGVSVEHPEWRQKPITREMLRSQPAAPWADAPTRGLIRSNRAATIPSCG